jgi:hypothetical protein
MLLIVAAVIPREELVKAVAACDDYLAPEGSEEGRLARANAWPSLNSNSKIASKAASPSAAHCLSPTRRRKALKELSRNR